METKKCRQCYVEKPLDDFYLDRSSKDGKYRLCRDCTKAYNRSIKGRRGPNPGTHDSEMDSFEWAQLVVSQGGCCALCRERTKRLCVDHDHATKVVRGALCYSCNSRLGKLERERDWVLQALRYIGVDALPADPPVSVNQIRPEDGFDLE
jgi:hypothetical protein